MSNPQHKYEAVATNAAAPAPQQMHLGGRTTHSMAKTVVTTAFIVSLLMYACMLHWGVPGDSSNAGPSLGDGDRSWMQVMDDPHPKDPWPRVAWLMSFPNSGTTYTTHLVIEATNTSTATAYGEECVLDAKGNSLPVSSESPNGPFVKYPSLGLPTGPGSYVLTKTHCGSRCLPCTPKKYIETERSFLRKCLTGHVPVGVPDNITGHALHTNKSLYDEGIIQRAVHLVRDPIDNIVARFHYEWKRLNKTNAFAEASSFVASYPPNRDGFRAWCHDIDNKFMAEEKKSRFIDDDLMDIERSIPCRADFFKFAQWHNLAFAVSRRMRLPVHVMHYENYTYNFDEVVDGLFNFLGLRSLSKPPEFIRGKHYWDYFTEAEQSAIKALLREVSTRETWEVIWHYFDG